MEFIDLKELWELNNNTKNLELTKKGIETLSRQKVKHNLSEIEWSAIIEISLTSIWFIFLTNFILEHRNIDPYFYSSIFLILAAIFSIILESRKLFLYKSLDYTASLLKSQTIIERLKFWEELDLKLIYILIPLFVVPFSLVFCKGIVKIDLLEYGFGTSEVISLLIGSILIAIMIVFLLRKTAFKELNASIQFIKEMNEFE